MRFASIGGQSNYAQAGKAVANDAAKTFDVARKNSVDFGGLAQAAMKTRSDEKVASMRAGAQVSKASIDAQAYGKVKDAKRSIAKDGVMRKAGGLIALGVGGLAEKSEKSDYSLYDKKIADIKEKNAADTLAMNAIDTSGKKVETPATAPVSNTGGTAASSTSSTSSSSSVPGNQASASGGSLNFASVKDYASKAGAKYPELVAAQWALESGYGKSPSGKNNYFGIKATSGEDATSHQTWEVRNGKNVTESARFKNFDTPQGSINEVVSKWHMNYGNYSGVNNAGSAFEAADMLRQQGYATDPAYSKKLQRIMKENA